MCSVSLTFDNRSHLCPNMSHQHVINWVLIKNVTNAELCLWTSVPDPSKGFWFVLHAHFLQTRLPSKSYVFTFRHCNKSKSFCVSSRTADRIWRKWIRLKISEIQPSFSQTSHCCKNKAHRFSLKTYCSFN